MRIRLALGVPLLGLILLAGCVTSGSIPEIPLVPVPPPPLGTGPLTASAAPTARTPADQEIPPPTATRSLPEDNKPPVAVEPAPKKTPRDLYQAALARSRELDSYIARLTRRETVGGKPQPEEVMMFRFRARPWSVYFKWLGKEGQGREVIHVQGQHGDKIHSLLAAGDVPFMPAGKRMSLSPDSILVKSACRHPISEAGLVASVNRVGKAITAVAANPHKEGTLTVLGPLNRPEFEQPVLALEHVLPPRADPTLPQGGKRTYYFCPQTQLPTLVIALDDKGQEAEYYRYDRLLTGVKLDDADFDPEHLWQTTQATASR